MPDSPVRPGPPIPPSLADSPAAPAGWSPARGPYGLPFPRARVTPASLEQPVTFRPRPNPARPPDHAPGRGKRRAPGFVALVLVVVLVCGALWADRGRHDPVPGYGVIPQPGAPAVATEAGIAVGDAAPNFRLLGTDGEIVELASLRGQPVLVHFWTTWCLDCAAELPLLQDLSARSGDTLQVIGIDAGEPAGRVGRTAERHGVTYQVLLDGDGSVAAAYGVATYPATIVIDADGVVRAVHSGVISGDQLQAQIDAVRSGQ